MTTPYSRGGIIDTEPKSALKWDCKQNDAPYMPWYLTRHGGMTLEPNILESYKGAEAILAEAIENVLEDWGELERIPRLRKIPIVGVNGPTGGYWEGWVW